MDDLSGLPSGTMLDGILKTLNLDGSMLGEVLCDFSDLSPDDEVFIAPKIGVRNGPVYRLGVDILLGEKEYPLAECEVGDDEQ